MRQRFKVSSKYSRAREDEGPAATIYIYNINLCNAIGPNIDLLNRKKAETQAGNPTRSEIFAPIAISCDYE